MSMSFQSKENRMFTTLTSNTEKVPPNYTGTVQRPDRLEHYSDGKLHCIDGPAVVGVNGSKSWFHKGIRHRIDGPSFEGSDGSYAWFYEGTRHRIGGPAYVRADGYQEWWVDGKLHRIGGPARKNPNKEDEEWWVDGKLHRIGDPAKIDSSMDSWWFRGRLHNLEGHARLVKVKGPASLTSGMNAKAYSILSKDVNNNSVIVLVL